MGRFTRAVQADDVVGPLRTGFKAKNWQRDFERLGEDDRDKNLYESGLLILQKADAIRSRLKVTFAKHLRATTKLRAFAALANLNLCTLQTKTHEAFEEIIRASDEARPGMPTMAHELAALTVKLPIGAEYRPNEVIQATVDGMQVPLKRILEVKPDLSGNPEFGRLDWSSVHEDFNLGVMYSFAESLWEDCCWNGYLTKPENEGIRFEPNDLVQHANEIVSHTRHERLGAEFALHGLNARQRLLYGGFQSMAKFSVVRGVKKDGRNQTLQLEQGSLQSDDVIALITLQAYAKEPYYTELIDEPQDILGGASLGHLLTGWVVISTAAARLRDALQVQVPVETADQRTWLPRYAPTLQFKALRVAVATATECNHEQAGAIVKFLTYRGESDQELWAQPLLSVGGDSVVPIFAATHAPNLRRLVDVWLKQLGVDISKRGLAFEAYIRSSICEDIAASPLLSKAAKCLETHLKFTPAGEREEEIDLVMLVGGVLVLGEAKCFLEPTEPKETARHREKVGDAADQITRKMHAVLRNRDQFRKRAREVGLEVPEGFIVQPMVVLNNAILAGLQIDGVPVVDEHMLGVFFRGEFVEFATSSRGQPIKIEKKRVLYGSADEGADAFLGYLAKPPQLEPLWKGVNRRWIPIAAVSEKDWPGLYLSVSCVPVVDLPESFGEDSPSVGAIASTVLDVEVP
jgi:hypothetical protein